MRTNRYVMRIGYIQILADDQVPARVLGHLGDAVLRAGAFLEDVRAVNMPSEYSEAITDYESEFVEALAGSAFVVCQTLITAVANASSGVLEEIRKDTGIALDCIQPSREGAMQSGNLFIAKTTVTRVQVMDACANYFKHGETWDKDWTPERTSRQTIERMRAIGGEPGSTGNLRHGLAVLGLQDCSRLQHLWYDLRSWATALAELLRTECQARHLI
jgi:hypothetical protein